MSRDYFRVEPDESIRMLYILVTNEEMRKDIEYDPREEVMRKRLEEKRKFIHQKLDDLIQKALRKMIAKAKDVFGVFPNESNYGYDISVGTALSRDKDGKATGGKVLFCYVWSPNPILSGLLVEKCYYCNLDDIFKNTVFKLMELEEQKLKLLEKGKNFWEDDRDDSDEEFDGRLTFMDEMQEGMQAKKDLQANTGLQEKPHTEHKLQALSEKKRKLTELFNTPLEMEELWEDFKDFKFSYGKINGKLDEQYKKEFQERFEKICQEIKLEEEIKKLTEDQESVFYLLKEKQDIYDEFDEGTSEPRNPREEEDYNRYCDKREEVLSVMSEEDFERICDMYEEAKERAENELFSEKRCIKIFFEIKHQEEILKKIEKMKYSEEGELWPGIKTGKNFVALKFSPLEHRYAIAYLNKVILSDGTRLTPKFISETEFEKIGSRRAEVINSIYKNRYKKRTFKPRF
jgi:hypothetical protein